MLSSTLVAFLTINISGFSVGNYILTKITDIGTGKLWRKIKEQMDIEQDEVAFLLYDAIEASVASYSLSDDLDLIAPVCEILYGKWIEEGCLSEINVKIALGRISSENKNIELWYGLFYEEVLKRDVLYRYVILRTTQDIRQQLLFEDKKITEELGRYNRQDNNQVEKIVLSKLENLLSNLVLERRCEERLIPLIKDAMLGNRECRRAVHISIGEASQNIKRQFLDCMWELTRFPDEHVRGEAYFCLGELTDDRGHIDEDFFAKGLKDEKDFVKACCANVLHHYIPLKATTLELLKNEIVLYDVANSNESQKKLYYYAKKTLTAHREYLKLVY